MEVVDSQKVREALDAAPTSHYGGVIFNQVYEKAKGMIVNKTFTLANWIALVTLCMELVEVVPGLHGIEKRNLVVDLVSKLITEIPMSDSDRAAVEGIIRTTLPAIIDVIVQGSLGELAINLANQVQEETKKCFARCNKKE